MSAQKATIAKPAQDRQKDSLWLLILGPSVWAVFFLAVYVVAAVYCAKAPAPEGGFADIRALRLLIAAFALAACAIIAVAGGQAWARWQKAGGGLPPHGDDTRQSRHQFMSLATLLLCGLSFVATIYVALPAVFIGTCR